MGEGSGSGREEKLSQLLADASKAHSVYEKDVLCGVRDEKWPDWYADYLATHGIEDLPVRDSEGSEPQEALALLLAEADQAHRQLAPQEPWPQFYARYLLGGHARRSDPAEPESR